MLAKELAEQEKRISFRKKNEYRSIKYEIYPGILIASGEGTCISIMYRHGNIIPYREKPFEGIFQLTVSGRKNDVLGGLLHSIYIKNRSISLNVNREYSNVEGLFIDVKVISDNGGVLRLASEGINKIIDVLDVKKIFAPKVHQYCFLNGNLICDPDLDELMVSEWYATIVMRSSREILYFQKHGKGCSPEDLENIMNMVLDTV